MAQLQEFFSMQYQKISKTLSYYLFCRPHGIIILALLAATLVSGHFFLQSGYGRHYLDRFSVTGNRNVPAVLHLTQTKRWISPASGITRRNTTGTFDVNPQERQWLVDWISKRYPVNAQATELFVSAAYLAAHEIGLDPHLILAVMAVESSFNPKAESPVGAQGLMQVMPQVHSKRFEPHGGIEAAKDPVTNIRVGSAILKEYVSRGGSVEQGLKSYVGAAAHSHDFGYGAKVLEEYHRLKQVSRGEKVPTAFPSASAPKKLARSDTRRPRVTIPPARAEETANA